MTLKMALYAVLTAFAVSMAVWTLKHHKAVLGAFWATGAAMWTIICVGMSFSGVIV